MPSSKTVLKSDELSGQCLTFVPHKFKLGVPSSADEVTKDRHLFQTESTSAVTAADDFRMDPLVVVHTGLKARDAQERRDIIDQEVLARLKSIEEKAYKESQALGFDDGRKQAFQEATNEIKKHLDDFKALLTEITEMKTRMVLQNEASLVKTVYALAQQVAFKEIKGDPAVIIEVLKQALEGSQSDEELTLRLSPSDKDFLQKIKGTAEDPTAQFTRLKVEAKADITPGGCILESNYGIIDATIEQRVARLWEALNNKIPKAGAAS